MEVKEPERKTMKLYKVEYLLQLEGWTRWDIHLEHVGSELDADEVISKMRTAAIGSDIYVSSLQKNVKCIGWKLYSIAAIGCTNRIIT